MEIVQYTLRHAQAWDDFVRRSKNGTFLLQRPFMDYHAERFTDCSLMVFDDGTLVALFPANWDPDTRTVYSHQGLTYGGLILSTDNVAAQVLSVMQLVLLWCIDYLQARRLVYKPIPFIYSQCPAEEDRYALFRAGAKLKARAVSSVVPLRNPLRMRKLRLRGARKAIDNGLYIDRMVDADWDTLALYWQLLTQVLRDHHGVSPVHTLGEMKLLMTRFPQQIKLFLVRRQHEILAGCVVFVTTHVAHIQYIAAGDEGRSLGALDLLFRHLINERFRQLDYLDFGISTEQGGQVLNEGLIFQKEGFGARAVCYDTYELELSRILVEQLVPLPQPPVRPVQFLDLRRINASFEPRLTEAVARVVSSGRYLQGTATAAFERHFADYTGVRHCVLCANGMEALTLILRACRHLRGWTGESEVIVPANTFIATILAIREAGLRPVLAEPRLADALIDTARLPELLTPRTVALLPVHLYGRVCPMKAINAFAKDNGLLVIEDAAQAHGAMLAGRKAGALGHAAAFSFYPAKNLGALGDAGCVTTDDDLLAQTIRIMANYGSAEKYVHQLPGINSRTDELQAAALDVKLPRLDHDNQRRRDIARRYAQAIDNPLVTLPAIPRDEREHVFHVYAVRTGYRQELQDWLKDKQIETVIHYPIPPHRQQALAGITDRRLHVTEQIHREILSLPISPLMTDDETDRVIAAVNKFNPA